VSSTGGSAKGVKMANQNPEPEDVESDELEHEEPEEDPYLRAVRDEGGAILYWE
jgi:hypothetical protein